LDSHYYFSLGEELGVRISKRARYQKISTYNSSITAYGTKKQLSIQINKDTLPIYRGSNEAIQLVKQGIDKVLSK